MPRWRIEDWLGLGLLALLWGGSYPLIKLALAGLPPLTLMAGRVALAALILCAAMLLRSEAWPRGAAIWRRLALQSVFNATGAWTLLAWGQTQVDAGLAGVLNSTSPVFICLAGLAAGTPDIGKRQVAGAITGLAGVALVIGPGAGGQVAGMLVCLGGAALYAAAALHGRSLGAVTPLAAATATMLCAAAVLVPAAWLFDRPLSLRPGGGSLRAALALAVFCTAGALLLYFRLLRRIGALAVASQSYLRAIVALAIGVVVLGERLTPLAICGSLVVLAGVALMTGAPAGQARKAIKR